MKNNLSRKHFIVRSLSAASGLIIVPGILRASPPSLPGDPLDRELVKSFLIAAHTDADKTKSMLAENSNLINSVYNLGQWDWEDAVGAAGHMGHADLARYLLEKGARMTICVAAMLGEINVIKSMISAFPYMKDAVGPHNISLLNHAKAGGDAALPVVEYLNSLGITK